MRPTSQARDNPFFNPPSKVGTYLAWNLNRSDKLVKSKTSSSSGPNTGSEVLMIPHSSSCSILKSLHSAGRRGELASFRWWLVARESNVLLSRGASPKYTRKMVSKLRRWCPSLGEIFFRSFGVCLSGLVLSTQVASQPAGPSTSRTTLRATVSLALSLFLTE